MSKSTPVQASGESQGQQEPSGPKLKSVLVADFKYCPFCGDYAGECCGECEGAKLYGQGPLKPGTMRVEDIRKEMMARFSNKLSMEEIADFAYLIGGADTRELREALKAIRDVSCGEVKLDSCHDDTEALAWIFKQCERVLAQGESKEK